MIDTSTRLEPEAISILVDDVQRHFRLNGQLVKAVDGVSFAIPNRARSPTTSMLGARSASSETPLLAS